MARMARTRGRATARFTSNYELVPQTFLLPLGDFAAANRDFTAQFGHSGAQRERDISRDAGDNQANERQRSVNDFSQ